MVLLLLSGLALPGAMPEFRVLALERSSKGVQHQEFVEELLRLHFAIAKKEEMYWHRLDGSIYSFPSLNLQRAKSEICIGAVCDLYWAQKNQNNSLISSFAHTYRFVWAVERGRVVEVQSDHSLWRGNF